MTAYLILAAILLLFALANVWAKSRWLGVSASLLVGSFTALRYQLGYDWVAYERLFQALPGTWSFGFQPGFPQLQVEPLFLWLCIALKSLGGTVEVLFFGIAAFNVFVIHFVCQRIAPNSQPFVWLFYFCFAVVAVQMNIVRQALASSFVLLGLLCLVRSRPFFGTIPVLVGSGIQVSSAIFAPLWLIGSKRPNPMFVGILLAAGSLAIVTKIDILKVIIEYVKVISPDWLNYKFAFYEKTERSAVSLSAVFFMIWNAALLVIFYLRRRSDPAVCIAAWLTLYMLAAHLFFSQYPTIWNRTLAVALPWQLATVYRMKLLETWSASVEFAGVATIGIIAIAGLAYQLGRPQYGPFVPYHSVIQARVFGDEGTGRARAEQAIEDYESGSLGQVDKKTAVKACAASSNKAPLPKPYLHFEGFAFKAHLPSLTEIADTDRSLFRSPAVLCENDHPIGPAHGSWADIVESGLGRFSHYEDSVVFSSSDNSDPNFNGRLYTVVVPAKKSLLEQLTDILGCLFQEGGPPCPTRNTNPK
jgi:EpsG family